MIALEDVHLVLASTSRYRRELLSRLTKQFRVVAPHVDETPVASEAPHALVVRLAEAKARAVADQCNKAIVIGSDQAADLDGTILGKPGSAGKAREQLSACSGRDVIFRTALCVIDTHASPAKIFSAIDVTRVRFRELSHEEIARYVEVEQPLDCAGSFKSEALGIALFESISSDDPTAIVGLPLIALCGLLRDAGISVP